MKKRFFDEHGQLILPKGITEEKEKKIRSEKMNDFLTSFSKKIGFKPDIFFKKYRFEGSCTSKRNKYYVYSSGKHYLICTGIKTKTNYNLLLKEEIQEIHRFIGKKYADWFTMMDIISELKTYKAKQKRIKAYIEDYQSNEEKDQRKYLYGLILEICYILTAKGSLTISKRGREIIFKNAKNPPDKTTNIFKNIKVVTSFEKMVLLKDTTFYYTIKYKNMRGSIFPYLIDEISYLSKLVNSYDKGEQINIIELIQKMDYQQRFNEIYNMIMEQNLRNQREKTDYFKSRIKAALKIVQYLKHTIQSDKHGRKLIFQRC